VTSAPLSVSGTTAGTEANGRTDRATRIWGGVSTPSVANAGAAATAVVVNANLIGRSTLRRAIVVAVIGVAGCAEPGGAPASPGAPEIATTDAPQLSPDPVVWYNPYGGIRWDSVRQYKAQTHDHTGVSAARLLSYDSAGYTFVPIMEYSGVASLAYSVTGRLWPSDSVLPPSVLASSANARTWVPSGEEIGFQHFTSLFLTQYVAKWEPGEYEVRMPWMYESTQEAIDLVREAGGFPILSHPWGAWPQFSSLSRYSGIEIYTAYAEHFFEEGSRPYFAEVNRNSEILSTWDRILLRGDFVVGVAVNDHFGPYRSLASVSRRVRDSGKILVIAQDSSLASYQSAMWEGAILAVRDMGEVKDRFPVIDSITNSSSELRVWTAAEVTWVVDGTPLGITPPSLNVVLLPAATRFVRAEVRAADSSVVYTQPFLVRPRGDVNGDFSVNADDGRICAKISAGQPATRTIAAACAARVDGQPH
jgi:hypothetical protein